MYIITKLQKVRINLSEVDSEYLESVTKAIVDFKANIEKLEGKAKLRQNHSKSRQENIAQILEENGTQNEQILAFYMKESLGYK